MSKWWRRLSGLVAVGVVSTIVVQPIAGVDQAGAVPGDGLVSILVMGDSYSAGNGAGAYYGPMGAGGFPAHVTGCFRSTYNYARQFQRIIESSPFNQHAFVHNEACNGAVTDDIWEPRDGRRAQVDAVDKGYDVIFLTTGGNDLQFSDIAKTCLVKHFQDGADCGHNLDRAERLLRDGTEEAKITKALTEIHLKAHSEAKIVLLGYPFLESNTALKLHSGHTGSTYIDVGKRLHDIQVNGDALQQRVVDKLNAADLRTDPFVFVNPKSTFAGHELTADRVNPNRWFIQPWSDALPEWYQIWYHPNRQGHTAEAKLLAADPRVPKSDVRAGEGVPHNVDVMLTIDTTGSMSDDIAAVKANATALVDRLAASGASWRVGLVTYKDVPPEGDAGDYASRMDLAFSSDRAAINSAIAAISVSGGGDGPETVLSGIKTAVDQPWRDGAKKAIIVLGDAPPHDPEATSHLTSSLVINAALAVDPAEIYPVLINPYAELTAAFEPLATGTGGQVVTSTGGEDVVDALAEVLKDVSSAPIASAGGPYAGDVGEAIPLSASASLDPDGSITSYEWDFDGNGTYDQTTPTPLTEHTYDTPFDGQLSVRVTDDNDLQTVAMAPVTIIEHVDISGPEPEPVPEPSSTTTTADPGATPGSPTTSTTTTTPTTTPPTTDGRPRDWRLPATGWSVSPWLAIGAGLFCSGVALVLLAARRHRPPLAAHR
jgi:lysophospholipase L1-like esterase